MSKKHNLLNNFKILWTILSKKEKTKSIIFLFFTFLQVFLEAISIGSLYPLILGLFGKNENLLDNDLFSLSYLEKYINFENQILLVSFLIVIVFIIKNTFLIFLVHWTQTFERNVKVRLKKHLLTSYLYKSYTFHVNKDSAKLVRNINTSTSTVMQTLRSSMLFINDSCLFIVLFLFLTSINPVLVLYSSLSLTALTVIYFLFFKRLLIKYGKFSFEHEGESLKKLIQSFNMIKEIKLFQKENYFIKFFHLEEKLFQEFQRKAYIIRSYPRAFFELIFIFGVLSFINIKFLTMGESFDEILPKTALLALILIRMIPSISRLISSAQKINQYQKSNYEIIDDLKTNILENKNRDNNSSFIGVYEFNKINLEKIYFRYSIDNKYIFENFNFEIKKGSYLGIVGPSGCGKSTLIDLLTGLLKADSGNIKINDEDADLNSAKWKNLFGYVSQTVNLFNDTVYTNITFEKNKDKINIEKLYDAINKSGLDPFIKQLENGIDSKVGEFGYKISGGEKQRISIARALYKDPQILIFDESFNSLDKVTKRSILDEINNIRKFKTIIVISHLLEDLTNCDQIVELSKVN